MKEKAGKQQYSGSAAVPVQLEDDGAIHDGETQETDPPQEDTSKHTGVEVQDHHLLSDTTHIYH